MKKKDFQASAFGKKIRQLRKAKNLSQEELAEMIDKTVDTVSNVERGISSTRIDTAHAIATALDVQLYELFQAVDVPPADKEKAALLDEVHSLLKQQPLELLQMIRDQVKHLVALKESLLARLKKEAGK